MDDTDLLNAGEKIKKIRKDSNIKQGDITGGKITRNLVSLSENNSADLTKPTSEVISESISDICKQREINMTADDLLNNTIQADEKLNDIIKEINNHRNERDFALLNIINKAEKLIKENPYLNKIIDLYTCLGDTFLIKKDIRKAYIFYFKVYEHLDFNRNRLISSKAAVRLSYCCNNLYKFSETVQIVNTILSSNVGVDRTSKYKMLYNLAIAQKNLKQYSDAINSLNKIDENEIDDCFFFYSRTVKGNCYKNLKLYKEALDIHFNLLNHCCKGSIPNTLLALSNIVDIYRKMKNVTNIRKYLLMAMSLIINNNIDPNNYFLVEVYYDLALSSIYIRDEKDALILLNKALTLSKDQNKYMFEFKSLNSMFDIYYKNENYQYLEELKISLFELLLKSNKAEFHELVYKYIKMYDMRKERAELKDLANFMIGLTPKEA